MTVTLLDTKTGARRDFSDYDPYWWAEGNGSCDCNRRIMMGVDLANDKAEDSCEGCARFLVVGTDTDEYTLAQLNDGYPKELLIAYGIQ